MKSKIIFANGIVTPENPIQIVSPENPSPYQESQLFLYRPLAQQLKDRGFYIDGQIKFLEQEAKKTLKKQRLPIPSYFEFGFINLDMGFKNPSRLLEFIYTSKNTYGLNLLPKDRLSLDSSSWRDHVRYRLTAPNQTSLEQAQVLFTLAKTCLEKVVSF